MSNKKFKSLIWQTVKECGNSDVFETKLWKLLFFIEVYYYEKYQEKVSDIDFVKNIHGPTPEYKKVSKLLEELVSEEFLNITNSEKGGKIYRFNKNFETELSEKELLVVQEVCEKFGKLSSKELSMISHNEPVYLMAEKLQDKLDFKNVIYRSDDEEEYGSAEYTENINLSEEQGKKLKKILRV